MKNYLYIVLSMATSLSMAQQLVTAEDVVRVTLEKNYDIKAQQINALSAEANKKFAYGNLLPQVNATASRLWNNNNTKQTLSGGVETSKDGITSNNIIAGLQLTWTLFDGTKMFATMGRLRAQSDLGTDQVRAQINNSTALVLTNYFNIVRQKQQLNAIREQMSVSEERVKLATLKLQAGTGSKPELLQAKIDLNAQRTLALQQEIVIQQLKGQLNTFLGMALPESYEISDTIPVKRDFTLDKIKEAVEKNNTAVAIAARNVSIAEWTMKESRRARSPIINFVSAYNFNRTENTVVINTFTPLFNRNQGYNYGFTATIPILNGLNGTRMIRQTQFAYEQQKVLLEQQKAVATVGASNSFIGYFNALQVLAIESENIGLAKENVAIALAAFRQGIMTFIELRTAQQSWADAYNRYIGAQYNAKVAEIELMRLQGALVN